MSQFSEGQRVKLLTPRYLHRTYHHATGTVEFVARGDRPEVVKVRLDSGVSLSVAAGDLIGISTADFERKMT
jgi:hypothetical protein